MEQISGVLGIMRELAVPLVIFIALLIYSVIRGQRALTSVLLSLYISLLVSLEFPYYDVVASKLTFMSGEAVRMLLFGVFTALGTILMEKILSRLLDETAFEGITKKAILAVLVTILLLSYSYHVLPLTKLIDPGSQMSALFGPKEYFFWWLTIPLIGLFILF
jgi:phage-related holin